MMKFIVLALMAISIGLSESVEVQKFTPSFEAVLNVYYGLTLDEYKQKCLDKQAAYWDEILSIIELGAGIGEALINYVVRQASFTYGSDEDYDYIIAEHCTGNVVLLEVKNFTFGAVANCLDEDEIPDEATKIEIIKYSIFKTCEPIKEIAKERKLQKW